MKLLKLLFITLILMNTNCKKEDDVEPIDQLPAITQVGKGTFGCLVDGKAFVDKSGGYFNCFYQFVDGGYYFGIGGSADNIHLSSVILGTYSKSIEEGQTYILLEDIIGNAWGGSRIKSKKVNVPSEFATTNSSFSGTFTITKIDFEKKIVSGTFSFDLQNPFTNEVIQIREGRFDTLFTQ